MTSSRDCPDLAALSAYQDGALEIQSREAIEGHAASCLRCRNLLLALGTATDESLPAPPPLAASRLLRPRPGWPWAAAAALLLALSGWVALRTGGQAPKGTLAGDRATRSRKGFPAGLLSAGAYLDQGAELLAAQGARVSSLGPGRRLRAEAGTLWLEVGRGEPVVLELPGAVATLRCGRIAVTLAPKPRESWLLRDSFASERDPETSLWVLEGQVEFSGPGEPMTLSAGERLTWEDASWRRCPMTPEERARLDLARDQAAASVPGASLACPGLRLSAERNAAAAQERVPASYRWVTVLSRRDPPTELALTLGIGDRWHRWVVNLAGLPGQAREQVEVLWDGTWLTGRVNGRTVFSEGRDRLDRVLSQAEGPWTVSVWGGGATVDSCVLQEIP